MKNLQDLCKGNEYLGADNLEDGEWKLFMKIVKTSIVNKVILADQKFLEFFESLVKSSYYSPFTDSIVVGDGSKFNGTKLGDMIHEWYLEVSRCIVPLREKEG